MVLQPPAKKGGHGRLDSGTPSNAVECPAADWLFARLPDLQILDLRGGSGTSLEALDDARSLRLLVVNQIRGMIDISAISLLTRLEFLSLYGLRQVDRLPPLERLVNLKRVQLGQMRNLRDISALLGAPALEELFFHGRLGVQADDVLPLRAHPALRAFDWFWLDVPARQARPVLEALPLAKPRSLFPVEWLEEHDKQG